jgi:hypothetical protein
MASQIIYSDVKEIVEQGQYIFDTLWNRAIPAEQKINEIEKVGSNMMPIINRTQNAKAVNQQ